MLTRTPRPAEDNLRIDEKSPHVAELETRLDRHFDLQRCGKGRSVLQVYLKGKLGSNEALLLIYTDLERSFVSWAHQADPGFCRSFWGDLVKGPQNESGSEFKPGVTVEEFADRAIRYADSLSAKSP